MKKLLSLLMLLPVLGIMASCSDDKDLPQVTISIDYTGAEPGTDGVIQVAQDADFVIKAVRAVPVEGTKQAEIPSCAYYVDGYPVSPANASPYNMPIPVSSLELGKHVLTISATVLQVDKEIGFALTEFPFEVVEPTGADDPDEGGSGTITPDTKITGQE